MERSEIYSNEELVKIQQLETETLKEVLSICEKLGIEAFLIGGTALGTVRHGGFIPWDDDIDIGLTREDYNVFLEKAPALLSEKYSLQTPYNGKKNPYFYSKVRIKDTKFIEYCNRNLDINQGVYIDVFPFDEVPDNEEENINQFKKVQKLILLFTYRQSPDMLNRKPKVLLDYIKTIILRILHYLLKLIPHDFIVKKIDFYMTKYNGTGQKALACLNFPKRKTEYILKKNLYPLQECKFGEVKAKLPNNADEYLKTHYGNYMQLPPPELRYGHKPFIVDIGN